MAVHDPDSGVKEQKRALRAGRKRRVRIVNGQEVYEDVNVKMEDDYDDDEDEYDDEEMEDEEGDDNQQYVVLEVRNGLCALKDNVFIVFNSLVSR
jgi:hypothetical protein